MPDYINGKIYRIWSPNRPDLGCYIGSTCNTLTKRFGDHKSVYQFYKNGNDGYCSSFEILEALDARIELVESFPCESRDQLNAREGYWIRNTPECVNIKVAGRSNAESSANWYAANRQRVCAYSAEYRASHRESIRARASEKVMCVVCGCQIIRSNISTHNKTQKHLSNLANQQQLEPQANSEPDLEEMMTNLGITI